MEATERMEALGRRAKRASEELAIASTVKKNQALVAIAEALVTSKDQILAANEQDIFKAEENGIAPVMVDRLRLTPERIDAIAAAVCKVADLSDPVGETPEGITRPNGLVIYKTRVPMGVVGIIFESRPNVTVDAAALCLKSGNACILRGGKEAIQTNGALVNVMREAIAKSGLPADAVLLVEDTSRECATAMMKLNGFIDVLIPRGGAGLIQAVIQNATVPVIETGVGNCHVYVDSPCNLQMAADIIVNAKCSRPSVCNAAETLLVHQSVAKEFLPLMVKAMEKYNVELRGCPRTMDILGDWVTPATEEDYATEFNDYILAIKVVEGLEEAIEHIRGYSSGHSEAIVTESYSNSRIFTSRVDAAAVYVNASTRFTDGEEFGLGAEIGISTQKLHTRGPMGLRDLTTIKYIVLGNGQVR
ncbi:MAG: glutamate-5-semialdehyde dehydrogenase [Angelakisella sp.]|nr:glutamate-5-semialdehyde dehydrogenase [Angelakisella sp.]